MNHIIKDMAFRKFRIVLSKGWTMLLCSASVVVLALAGCRSKKATKSQQVEPENESPSTKAVNEVVEQGKRDNRLTPSVALPGDSKAVRDLIQESNDLKETLNKRLNSVIYGSPEALQRRARENEQMRHKIDSLDVEISKARQK